MNIIFWLVLAALYLALAIVTWILGKPSLRNFALMKKDGDTLIYEDANGKELGLESSLHKAFRAIIITDMIGFFLASIAAGISIFLQ